VDWHKHLFVLMLIDLSLNPQVNLYQRMKELIYQLHIEYFR
jgi:hypothetical protein